MGMIDKLTEERIKAAASIVDVVGDFVELRRCGKDYEGLCPFHDDRHIGSFKVSPTKNVASCFSCGWRGGPVDFLMKHENLKYPEALRWLASKYAIPIVGEQPMPTVRRSTPRPPTPELPMIVFPMSMVKARMDLTGNVLVDWLKSLEWMPQARINLDMVLELYAIGTVQRGDEMGWVIFWLIDDLMQVRTGKMMRYCPNGKRYKEKDERGREKYGKNWISAKLKRTKKNPNGWWSEDENRVERCLFGLHLIDVFPDATICIVESEKTAIMMQTVSNPYQRLWMATGGKSNLTKSMLEPIVARNRAVVVYPDADGIDEWRKVVEQLGYINMTVSNKLVEYWQKGLIDKKDDMADTLLRFWPKKDVAPWIPEQQKAAATIYSTQPAQQEEMTVAKTIEICRKMFGNSEPLETLINKLNLLII